jgi:hypothetical protein
MVNGKVTLAGPSCQWTPVMKIPLNLRIYIRGGPGTCKPSPLDVCSLKKPSACLASFVWFLPRRMDISNYLAWVDRGPFHTQLKEMGMMLEV